MTVTTNRATYNPPQASQDRAEIARAQRAERHTDVQRATAKLREDEPTPRRDRGEELREAAQETARRQSAYRQKARIGTSLDVRV